MSTNTQIARAVINGTTIFDYSDDDMGRIAAMFAPNSADDELAAARLADQQEAGAKAGVLGWASVRKAADQVSIIIEKGRKARAEQLDDSKRLAKPDAEAQRIDAFMKAFAASVTPHFEVIRSSIAAAKDQATKLRGSYNAPASAGEAVRAQGLADVIRVATPTEAMKMLVAMCDRTDLAALEVCTPQIRSFMEYRAGYVDMDSVTRGSLSQVLRRCDSLLFNADTCAAAFALEDLLPRMETDTRRLISDLQGCLDVTAEPTYGEGPRRVEAIMTVQGQTARAFEFQYPAVRAVLTGTLDVVPPFDWRTGEVSKQSVADAA